MFNSKARKELKESIEKLKKSVELTERAVDYIGGGYGGEWKISEEGQAKVDEEYDKGNRKIPVTLLLERQEDGDWFKLSFVCDGIELQNCTTKVLSNDVTQLQDLHMTIYK